MQHLIEARAADAPESPEEEADTNLQAELARQLHEDILLPFVAKHHEHQDFLIAALTHAAAVHAMAGAGMEPDDFAAFAREVAKGAMPQAVAMRAKMGGLHLGRSPKGSRS